jgi:hypothetical protein
MLTAYALNLDVSRRLMMPPQFEELRGLKEASLLQKLEESLSKSSPY